MNTVKILFSVVLSLLMCLFFGWVCYMKGAASVVTTTVVRSGAPYYYGVYFGVCAWEGQPWHSRQFCATDGTRDKSGHPK